MVQCGGVEKGQTPQPVARPLGGCVHPGRLRWERLGILFILGLVSLALHVSWRRWPHSLIDFGRELYLPWRLSEGAVLYRDLDHLFGPLSQYLNALVFQVFGPGLMHLVYANLVIYAGILTLMYLLARIAWGVLAAFAAACVFACVFSFAQFAGIGNYNYACPYSHESTHGTFLLLGMVMVCVQWFRRPSMCWAALAGICCGLCVLTKVEIAVAAVLVAASAAGLAAIHLRSGMATWLRHLAIAAGGVAVPNVLATAAFASATQDGWLRAWKMANNAWLLPFAHAGIAGTILQQKAIGVDAPAENLWVIGTWALGSFALISAIALVCLRIERESTRRSQLAGGIALVAACIGLATYIHWPEAGRVLPGMLLVPPLYTAWCWWRNRLTLHDLTTPRAVCAALLWVLACTLLLRMALNPRLYHYGFYQALPAMIVAVGVILRGVPAHCGFGKTGRIVFASCMVGLLGTMCTTLFVASAKSLDAKSQVVGEGDDRFYGYPPEYGDPAALVEAARQTMLKTPGIQSLIVVPEGAMVNYLARVPSTIACYTFFEPYQLGGDWPDRLLRDFRSAPPSHAMVISRDLTEYGISRFGATEAHGGSLMNLLSRDYEVVLRIGADPLESGDQGVWLLQRREPSSRPVAGR